MAAHGARRLRRMEKHLNVILGVEAICAAQGVEFRAPLKTSAPLQAVVRALRSQVHALEEDRYLAPDLSRAAALVGDGALSAATGLTMPDLLSSV
jgi:histidine ammonia-lyase